MLASTARGKRVQQQQEHDELALTRHLDEVPGEGCLAKECCGEMRSALAGMAEVFTADHPNAYGYSYGQQPRKQPGCALLAAVPDIGNATGPCAQVETAHLYAFLKRHPTKHTKPVVGVILEQGKCAYLEQWDGRCWETYSDEGYSLLWSNNVEYKADQSPCSSRTGGTGGKLSWSMGCSTEAPYGLRFRTKWNAEDLSKMCGSTPGMSFNLEKVVTEVDWTRHESDPHLPMWTCIDVPVPRDEKEHRLIAYSFGPDPCIAPETDTTDSDEPQEPQHHEEEEVEKTSTTTGSTAKSNSKRAAAELAAPLTALIALTLPRSLKQ